MSILSERRVFRPYGLEGGEDAKSGLNLWIKQRREEDGDLLESTEENAEDERQPPRVVNLGSKTTAAMGRGDRIVIHTPGGGGWGKPETNGQDASSKSQDDAVQAGVGGGSIPLVSATNGYHTTNTKGSIMEWETVQLGA